MAALFLGVVAIMAIPAKPGTKKTVTLDDGTTTELTLKGDEHYSYYVNEQGKPCRIVNGQLILMTPQEVGKQWDARKSARMEKVAKATNHRALRRAGKPSNATTGLRRGLVILMEFKDVKFVTNNPRQVFHRFFNEDGYSDYGMTGSVKDYFKMQSYGQLEIDFDVVGPYTTKNAMEYYGRPQKDDAGLILNNDIHPALMVAEGVDAADADVDFTNYDWDKDGEVDQVFVIYAGYAQAQGADENTIWPHEWALSSEDVSRIHDGVKINTYGCTAELRGKTGTSLDGIGSACHEFSHCLGLPDMYDTSGDENGNFGMGNWDIMCNGNYNNDSMTPAGYTSYERWYSGWMEPIELTEMTRITDMMPLAKKAEAYILYNDNNRNEFYMLENRQPVDFDSSLSGHGLLVLHVDYNEGAWSSNTVNNVKNHERMTIVPADGVKQYLVKSSAGDPYPGTSGNTSLTNYTSPAAELYSVNVDGTKLLSKPIDNITEDVTAKTVSFVACRPELGIPTPGEAQEQSTGNSFSISWPAVTGANGYEVELTAIDKAAVTPEEALQREFDFSGCISSSNGVTDISSSMGKYGLPSWSGSKLYTSPEKLKMGTTTATGMIRTPSWWKVPDSQEITFMIGAKPVKENEEVTANLTFESVMTNGRTSDIVTEKATFSVVEDSKHVVSFTVPKQNDLYRLTISPNKQMYLNYMAIYDGIWTPEQLGISNSTAARRATVITSYTTDNNSYTFTGLDTSKRYAYRVRAIGEENTYSQWSDEKMFEFSSTGIQSIVSEAQNFDAPVRYFDLQGRELGKDACGLVIMKQGNQVRKVMK